MVVCGVLLKSCLGLVNATLRAQLISLGPDVVYGRASCLCVDNLNEYASLLACNAKEFLTLS